MRLEKYKSPPTHSYNTKTDLEQMPPEKTDKRTKNCVFAKN